MVNEKIITDLNLFKNSQIGYKDLVNLLNAKQTAIAEYLIADLLTQGKIEKQANNLYKINK